MRKNSKKVVFLLTVGLLLVTLSLSSSAANNSLLENTVAENADSSYNETVPHLEENESYSIPDDEIDAINENLKEEGLTVKDITITALPSEKPVINPDEEYDPGSITVLPLPPRDGTLPIGSSRPSTFASAVEYDLEIVDITAKEGIVYPFAMKTEQFLLTIVNRGSKSTVSACVKVYINDKLVSDRTAFLAADKTTVMTTGTFSSLPPGGVNKVRVTVNEDKSSPEIDFSNNSMEKEFEWVELKRVVVKSSTQTFPIYPKKPMVYEDATIEFVIANEGNKDLYKADYELSAKFITGATFTDIKTGVMDDLKIGEKYSVAFTFTHNRGTSVAAVLKVDPDNIATPPQYTSYPKTHSRYVSFENKVGGLNITFQLDDAFRSEFVETDPDATAESIVDKGSVGFKEHFGIIIQPKFENAPDSLSAAICPLPYDEACGSGDCARTRCPPKTAILGRVNHHKSMYVNLFDVKPSFNSGKDDIIHLLTGYEMCSGLSGEHKTNIRGLAYSSGHASISQMKSEDMTRNIRFMQHELSHNLGAEDNKCYVDPVTGKPDPCIMTYDNVTWKNPDMNADVWCRICKEKIISNIPTRTY